MPVCLLVTIFYLLIYKNNSLLHLMCSMKTRKFYFFFVAMCFLGISCHSNKRQMQEANTRLSQVQTLIQGHQLQQAKVALDSIHVLYPTLIEIRKKAVEMEDHIKIAENTEKIGRLDSLIPKKELQLDSIRKLFVFEKDKRINTTGIYTHISQLADRNTHRTYLKANVTERGELFLTAIYYGKGKLNFNSLQVKTGDLQLKETIHENGADYTHQSFEEDGYVREMVTFNRIAENGICQFISENKLQAINVIFQGKTAYNYRLTTADKNAIANTYSLYNIVKDLVKMRQEKKNAEALLIKLKK